MFSFTGFDISAIVKSNFLCRIFVFVYSLLRNWFPNRENQNFGYFLIARKISVLLLTSKSEIYFDLVDSTAIEGDVRQQNRQICWEKIY